MADQGPPLGFSRAASRGKSRGILRKMRQMAYKPGSVLGVSTNVWPFLWDGCCHPPHATYPDGSSKTRFSPRRTARKAVPIWSCSRWGLPCHYRYRQRGALLPHLFTLTSAEAPGGLFSVALSLGFPPPGVTRHLVFVEPGLSSA